MRDDAKRMSHTRSITPRSETSAPRCSLFCTTRCQGTGASTAIRSLTIFSHRTNGTPDFRVNIVYDAANYIRKASACSILRRRDRRIEPTKSEAVIARKIGYAAGTNEYYLRQRFRKNQLRSAIARPVNMPVEDMPVTPKQSLRDAVVACEPYGS